LDIGGGTCDFAIYKDGRIRHSKVLAIAGNHFTNDIAVGLGIPFAKAEELKKKFGSVFIDDQHAMSIDVDMGYEGGMKNVPLRNMVEILNFRAEEVLELFLEEINQFRLRALMPCGLVLTGGGSLLAGMAELASEKLDMPVRVGLPEAPANNRSYHIPDILKSPIYATAYGLLVDASGERSMGEITAQDSALFTRVMSRMKSWIYDLF